MPPRPSDRGAARPDELQWIDVNDFRAGIVMDIASTFSTAPGAAYHGDIQVDTKPTTYGCCADPSSGMLMPLPGRRVNTTTPGNPISVVRAIPDDLTGASATNAGNRPQVVDGNTSGATYVLDARVIGPLIVSLASTNSGQRPENLAVLYGFDYNINGTGSPFFQYVLGRMWLGNCAAGLFNWQVARDFHFQKTTAASAILPPRPIGALAWTRTVKPTDVAPFGVSFYHPALCFSTNFYLLIGQATGTAIPAADRIMTTYDTDVTPNNTFNVGTPGLATTFTSVHGVWPDPSAVANAVAPIGSGSNLSRGTYFLVAHQGRLVAVSMTTWNQLDFAASQFSYIDQISYNPEPGQIVIAGNYSEYSPLNEESSGVGAAVSLPANSLLVIKKSGGAYMVSGDLDNPDIVRLPFVHSTGGVVSFGATTPIGFVYLGKDNVYAYAGGDRTVAIADQLDWVQSASGARLPFWDPRLDPTNEVYVGAVGRLAWWDPFIVCPNDWVYDTRTKSWWKLEENPPNTGHFRAPHAFFDVSSYDGALFAIPYRQDVINTAVADIYHRGQGRDFYSWGSQPFPESTERAIEVKEIELTYIYGDNATNAATSTSVTFDFYGVPMNGTTEVLLTAVSTSFTITSGNGVQRFRKRVRKDFGGTGGPVEGRNVRVVVTAGNVNGSHSQASSNNLVAPKIAFRIGYQPTRQVPYS